MKIYQSYVNNEEKRHLDIRSIPLDASWNNNGTEYELFKYIHTNENIENEQWGLISWKFKYKCPISVNEFLGYAATQFENGYDCVFVNPMIGNEAIYLNVWEQGKDVGHTNIEKFEAFLKNEFDPNITAVMSRKTFAFCNYFIGNIFFWKQYFKYVDKALLLLDSACLKNSDLGSAYNSSANYARNKNFTLKPFITERLFSTFLAKTDLKYTHYNYSIEQYQKKFGTILGEQLFNLSTLKNNAINRKSEESIRAYMNQRTILLNSQYRRIIWELDDPSPILFL
jgi:hypothetical protein